MDIANEIILEILKLLQKCDLKSARLVSKTWTTFAAELLFDQVYVSVHPENLEVFSAIAQHPLLSQCIKTLRYDAVEFVSTWNKRQYFLHLWYQTNRHFRHVSGSSKENLTSNPEINAWVKLVTTKFGFLDTDQRANESFVQVWQKCKDYDFICHGYEKYRKCSALQRVQLTNGTFLETLVGGLQKLTNLSRVIIGDR